MDKYTEAYYQAINSEERPQAKVLAEELVKMFHPRSLIDIGCGTGLYLVHFLPEVEAVGFDFSPAAFEPMVLQAPRNRVWEDDLRKPMDFLLTYDLTVCLEVLEHIGDEYVDIIVDNLCKSSDRIVTSAAPPGQAGLNHVNLQPQKYWDEKFEARGFKRNYHAEYQLVSQIVKVPHTVWIIRNLMVYEKN